MAKKLVPHWLDISVVGIQYRVTKSTRHFIMKEIENRGPLEVKLEREPENEHDENAIKVIMVEGTYAKMHIGYVRRVVAAVLAPYLDSKAVIVSRAHLVSLNTDDGEGEMKLLVKAPVGKIPGNMAQKKS